MTKYAYPVSSVPLKRAFTLSKKATAIGMESDMPIVRGLGPREDPTDMDVVLNVLFKFPILSARNMLELALLGAGLCLPVGRAVA